MRAAVYHGPNDLRVEDRPRPEIGPGEVLVRVIGCGVCGTDQRIVAGKHGRFPEGVVRIPGHEIVGEIVEAADDIAGDLPQGRVVVAPNMGCGRCLECLSGNNNRCRQFQAIGITLDGAFADFVRVPAAAVSQGNIIALDDGVDPHVATLIEPLACVLRGQDLLGIAPQDRVLVIGGGPIGILHVMLARLQGAGLVMLSDRWPFRRELAERQGADATIDPGAGDVAATVKDLTQDRGADVVILAAPSREAAVEALTLAAPGGRISYFAGLAKDAPTVAMDVNAIHYKELKVSGTTACSTRDCLRTAAIVNAGRLDLAPLVTERLALAKAPSAFDTQARDRRAMKTVLVSE